MNDSLRYVVRARAAGDFVLSETRYPGESALPTHAHEYACLVVALEGTFRERSEGKSREVAPGTVIARTEGEPHSNRFSAEGARCLNVELPPHVPGRSGAFRGGAFRILGRRLYRELLGGDDLSALAVESLVLGLFAEAGREGRRERGSVPRWLEQTKARLHDDPAARLTLGELAADAGVHPVYLATAFRRWFGQTVASYVRQLRIELACRQLASSDAPLADIALGAGFADQSHFGRAFRRAMQVTPAAYRAETRTP